jgi:elongation factor Ts
MQVAAMDPKAVSFEINPDSKLTKDDFLVNQSFIKDPSKTIQDLINEYVGKLGENIKIRRFERFSLGE